LTAFLTVSYHFRMRFWDYLLICLVCVAPAWAQQPVINEGPLNAASYLPTGLPAGGIAQGSMFIVKGTNLGPCGTVVANSFPLTTSLAGVHMTVTVGGASVDTKAIYVVACNSGFPDQLAAILPSNTPVGNGTLQVKKASGVTSAAVPIRVVANSFGVFSRSQTGTGPMIVQNFVSQKSTPTNSLLESAQTGQTEIIWGTGLGAVDPNAEIAGPVPGNLPLDVQVYVGGKQVPVTYKGRSGCCAGIDQIVFKVPEGVQGCYVAVAVRVNGVLSNVGTISVAPGETCSEPSGLTADDLAKIQQPGEVVIGNVGISRLQVDLTIPGSGRVQGTIDQGQGMFSRYRSTTDVMASAAGSVRGFGGTPSPGGCAVYGYKFSADNVFGAAFPDLLEWASLGGADASGALKLNGPRGVKQIPRTGDATKGFEYTLGDNVFLGGGAPLPGFPPILPAYLEPGTITLDNGKGGTQVGAFSSSLTIPASPLAWSNMDSVGNIPRTQDLLVTWTGGGTDDLVTVLGSSASPDIKAGSDFICVEHASAGSFTVPSWVLSALPASGSVDGLPVGFLFVASSGQPSRISGTGMDLGFFSYTAGQLKNVVYQ
jgi:uncharacterized protein (TIGR03437 family)